MLMFRLITVAALMLGAVMTSATAQSAPKTDRAQSEDAPQVSTDVQESKLFERPAPPPTSPKFLQLPYAPDKDFMVSLGNILSRYSRVARFGNTLAIQGTAEDHELAQQLVAQVTASETARAEPTTRDVQLAFYFIAARMAPTETATNPVGSPLPEALKPVAAALTESGFYEPRLLAPLVVQTRDDSGRSGARGRRRDFQIGGVARGVNSINVGGAAVCRPGQNSTELTINTQVTGAPAGRSREQVNMGIFELDTTLTVPFGDYVVLAAAPCHTDDLEAVVLVVKAEPVD